MTVGHKHCDWAKNDAHQMGRTVTTVIAVVQIAIGMVVILTCHQINRCCMTHHCLGMRIPSKGYACTEIGQQ